MLFIPSLFSQHYFPNMEKRVCIIGAGAAGVCAARKCLEVNALNDSKLLDVTIFEQSGEIGGTWIYNDIPLADKSSCEKIDPVRNHSSMYGDLM